MKLIPLTQGKFAKVDDDQYERLMVFEWFAIREKRPSGKVVFYAGRNAFAPRGNLRQRVVRMHAELINPPAGFLPDHKNGDGLDNQLHNLRIATMSQNLRNAAKRYSPASSRFKGVYLRRDRQNGKRWVACIRINGRNKKLGIFKEEFDAATAYNFAAQEHFEEFARFNL